MQYCVDVPEQHVLQLTPEPGGSHPATVLFPPHSVPSGRQPQPLLSVHACEEAGALPEHVVEDAQEALEGLPGVQDTLRVWVPVPQFVEHDPHAPVLHAAVPQVEQLVQLVEVTGAEPLQLVLATTLPLPSSQE